MMSPLVKHTFKAYDHRGRMVESTWTKVAAAFVVERAAFQVRLDRGELSHVDIFSSDPHEPTQRMHARARLSVVSGGKSA